MASRVEVELIKIDLNGEIEKKCILMDIGKDGFENGWHLKTTGNVPMKFEVSI